MRSKNNYVCNAEGMNWKPFSILWIAVENIFECYKRLYRLDIFIAAFKSLSELFDFLNYPVSRILQNYSTFYRIDKENTQFKKEW